MQIDNEAVEALAELIAAERQRLGVEPLEDAIQTARIIEVLFRGIGLLRILQPDVADESLIEAAISFVARGLGASPGGVAMRVAQWLRPCRWPEPDDRKVCFLIRQRETELLGDLNGRAESPKIRLTLFLVQNASLTRCPYRWSPNWTTISAMCAPAVDRHRRPIVARGRSARLAWFAPISPAGGITQYGRPGGLSRSDLYAPTLPRRIRPTRPHSPCRFDETNWVAVVRDSVEKWWNLR